MPVGFDAFTGDDGGRLQGIEPGAQDSGAGDGDAVKFRRLGGRVGFLGIDQSGAQCKSKRGTQDTVTRL